MAKKQITCPNCGAQIEPTQLLKVECSYCGSTFRNPLDREDKGREVIRKIVPFKISEKQMIETLFREFVNKNAVPQDIFDKLSILSVEQFYLPMYIFSGRFNADWSCTVIYSHTDRQGNTHEEYRPANGTVTGNFAKLALAHNSQNLPYGTYRFANVLNLTPDINSDIKRFEQAYLVGERGGAIKVVESNISIDDCWKGKSLQSSIENNAYNAARAQTSGWRKQDFVVSSNWRRYNNSDLVLMPIWYVRYTYDWQEYYFVMDGHDGRYDYTYPQDNTSVNRTWKIVARFFIMVALLGIIIFAVKDSISVQQGAVVFFYAFILTVSFIFEHSKSSKELSSIKQIGKARFCNEQTPNVFSDYVRYKRINQIMMWVLIGIVAVWSYISYDSWQKEQTLIHQQEQDSLAQLQQEFEQTRKKLEQINPDFFFFNSKSQFGHLRQDLPKKLERLGFISEGDGEYKLSSEKGGDLVSVTLLTYDVDEIAAEIYDPSSTSEIKKARIKVLDERYKKDYFDFFKKQIEARGFAYNEYKTVTLERRSRPNAFLRIGKEITKESMFGKEYRAKWDAVEFERGNILCYSKDEIQESSRRESSGNPVINDMTIVEGGSSGIWSDSL